MPSLLLASASLLCLATPVQAAPGLPDKPAQWQYAELSFLFFPALSAVTGPDGTVEPGKPPRAVVRWVTAEGEVEANGWADLADRLKAPAFKKEGSVAHQRVQVLNHLGREGWELVEQSEATTPKTWTFKRRMP